MNRTIYFLLIIILAAGCYKDKGNYEYSDLPEVAITLPFTTYEVGAGMKLVIDPEVITQISESDLNWEWEVAYYPPGTYLTFGKFAEGKKLDHVFNLSTLIPSTGTYSIRAHARQVSTGRDFYSAVTTLRITSQYTGLMVLHGNGTQSDIGLLQATDFRISEGTMETVSTPYLYSAANNNQKLPGKGLSVIQTYTYYQGYVDRAKVVAITDAGGEWINYADFTKGGDWNSMFMPGINKGQPQIMFPQGQNIYAVDGGQIFGRLSNSYTVFPVPSPAVTEYYAASPFFEIGGNYAIQGFFFDKNTRGFVESTNAYSFAAFGDKTASGISQIATSNHFNMADMKADLLHVDRGGRQGHFMAVMKEDDGDKFLAEINWSATANADLPYARYDMQVMPGMNDATFFAFGDNQVTMCYYATPSKVYRYTAIDGASLSGNYNELTLQNGTPIVFDGDITMMKILKPLVNNGGSFLVNYYNYNKIMLVAVYKNNVGTLYSLKLDESTGAVTSYTTFTGFDKIYDANIKGL